MTPALNVDERSGMTAGRFSQGFDRGLVSATPYTGKCEACGNVRLGVMFNGAADCGMLICAHCFAELYFALLPALSHELAKWGRT